LRSSSGSGYNSHGWEASLTGSLNRFFGLELDLSDHYNTAPGLLNYTNGFSFLFGPHFAYRGIPRANPYIHFLIGGTRGSRPPVGILVPGSGLRPVTGCPSLGPLNETAFSTGFGGGVDVKANRFLWVRVVQADYLREYFTGDAQNNLRLSFGVVLRFGR